MKVLVTGGCGFLGSHVCEYYLKKGHEVIAYDNMTKHELERSGFVTETARNYNRDYLEKIGVTLVKADIREYDHLIDSARGCHYIIHTAAQPAITISWEDPRLDITTNILGTFNVLEVARVLTVPVACCATIHVYGNRINESLQEGEKRYVRNPEGIDESPDPHVFPIRKHQLAVVITKRSHLMRFPDPASLNNLLDRHKGYSPWGRS